MGNPALPGFFGAGKDAVANGQRTALAPLHHAQAGGRLAFGFPPFGRRDQGGVVDIDDAQHSNLGHAAQLVERARRADVNQAFIGHILQQGFEGDLFLALKAESLGDLALARWLVGRGDEIHHLIAGGETGGTHLVASRALGGRNLLIV